MEQERVTGLINESISRLFKDALKVVLRNPSYVIFLLKTMRSQKRAARTRLYWQEQGLQVPAFMIASITNRCNLNCKGCYAMARHKQAQPEMSEDMMRRVFSEARELGISIILLAGGEPLVRPEVLALTGDFPEIIFPLFTNGLMMDDQIIMKLKKQKNLVPIISLEGYDCDTDERRGKGVYENVQKVIGKVSKEGLFFGASITMTRSTFDAVTGGEFIQELIRSGCRLFFFVEYVPVKEGTEDNVLTGEQRLRISDMTHRLREEYPALFIAFPGDEEEFGGCLASGRGFVHISPEGDLEPCPFAPYSDTNLRNLSLKDALQSKFLKTVREMHGQLSERHGGCTLWENREWVRSLLVDERPLK